MVGTNQADPLVPVGPPSCSSRLSGKPLWLSVLPGLPLSGCQYSLIVRRAAGIRLNIVDTNV